MAEHLSFDRLAGTTLGTYHLEQLIEQSEAGPIFLASKGSPKTLYRLRILAVPADLSAEDRIVYLGRFQQEANQVAALQHLHILPLSDYGNDKGMPYLVSPHLPMKSLRVLLTQSEPMNIRTVGLYLDKITAALEYAHQQAILHRNLTAYSIFIQSDEQLVVADFGVMHMLELSRSPLERKHLYETSEGSAPEQILGQPVDTYTDVYALGAVVYRMLTGQRVFKGPTRDEMIEQHLHAPLPSLANAKSLASNGSLVPALDKLLARAMAKDPKHRFQQPAALANAYYQIIAPNDLARTPFVIASPTPVADPSSSKGSTPLSSSSPMLRKTDRGARSRTSISRRQLIIAGGGTAAAVAALAVFGGHLLTPSTSSTLPATTNQGGSPSTPSSNPPTTPSSGTQVLARTSDVPQNSAKTFAIENSNNPGILCHLSDNRFVAFDSTCTHASCAVDYNSQSKLLACPCHGALFDPAKNAAVVQGPAPTPLTPIKISVNSNGTITRI